MKINKAKLLVGTLAVAAVAATVGSISGTVAWFQYSTRSTVAYQGAAAHCSENLQVRLYRAADSSVTPAIAEVKTEWKQDLTSSDIATFLSAVRGDSAANKLAPVTSGKLAANTVPDKLYKNPIYQYGTTSLWGEAGAKDYVDLPLQFRVLDVDGSSTQSFLAKKIYLTDLEFAAKTGEFDATSALRVVVDNNVEAPETPTDENPDLSFKQVFSLNGSAVNVGGELDLNADGQLDLTEGYEWTPNRTTVKYGDFTNNVADKAYSQSILKANTTTGEKELATANDQIKLADDSSPYAIKGKSLFTTSVLGSTETAESKNDWAGISIRIYLEGWTSLSTPVSYVKTSYASVDAMSTALSGTTPFVPSVGAYYQVQDTDKTVYKCTAYTPAAGQTPAAATFVALEDGKDSSPIWDAATLLDEDTVFNVGMRFTAEAHADHE